MKKLSFLYLVLVLISSNTSATSYSTPSLEYLVFQADHIFRANIDTVEVIDVTGNVILDPKARIEANATIRYQLNIKNDGVIRTNLKDFPRRMIIEESTLSILSVSQVRRMIGKEVIILLPGKMKEVVHISEPSGWIQSASSEREIVNIVEKQPKGRLHKVVPPSPPAFKINEKEGGMER